MNPQQELPSPPASTPPNFSLERGADCWNQVGIFGNGTCPELPKLVHCRNCVRHSAAALELLERPLPPGYREERTRQFAAPRKPRNLRTGSYILFRLDSEWLGLPTAALQEISEHRSVHSLPHQRPFILGLANVRGELLICISLAHFLGLGRLPDRQALRVNYSRLLVINWNGARLCFPAHEVQGPRRLTQEELLSTSPAAAKSNTIMTTCILHAEQKSIRLLDATFLCSALHQTLT